MAERRERLKVVKEGEVEEIAGVLARRKERLRKGEKIDYK